MSAMHANGLMSPPQTEKAISEASPPRVILAGKTGRILCVADIRGDYHELNRLIREHDATAVIHTGDFGFINAESLDRMSDKILRHLLQYSPLLAQATRTQLLSIPASAGRATLINALNNSSIYFPLSQFPHLLSGAINFPVPVFTVWGLIEDVRILERFRTGEYEVNNLFVLDEASTRLLDVSGLKLRLLGLGGAVAPHKMFDNGDGLGTIAGGQGTMWTTALQIGELVDTAQRVFDPTETRMLITSAPISRNGLLTQLANTVKADLTVSSGLHFRYPASFNEFSIHGDFESYVAKLSAARDTFQGVYNSVKDKVDQSLSEQQHVLLRKALAVVQKTPDIDDGTWTSSWHWVLSDASCGYVLFSITDGRVSAESKSNGLNFAHRVGQAPQPPNAPVQAPLPIAAAPRPADTPSKAAPPARPTVAGIPARPVPSSMNNFAKPIGQRQPQILTKPQSVLPAASSTPQGSTIPAKPVQPQQNSQPTRQPRGPSQPAAPIPAQKSDTKTEISSMKPPAGPKANTKAPVPAQPGKPAPPAKPPTPGPVKSSTPTATKTPAPAPAKPSSATAAAKTPAAAPAKSSTPKPSDTKAPKPDETTDDTAEKISDTVNGDKTENGGLEVPSSRTASMEGKPRKSLYLRGIPVPVTEDEIKSLFPVADKIVAVKIIVDRLTNKQRDFAYVDFGTEEDMQAALAKHGSTIRDTTISVVVSNPPSRFETFRGRGRGGLRGGRGGRGSFGGRKEGEGGVEKKESGEKKTE
ncbi:hypothetical protein BCR39DRAFT_561900 [Naematelia encephala]|uniref:RRM domain-containing protein n=1 Tax=Naematelia encephala TaxID=71784 RepID=A0A1Y2ALS7_9TREE|nr:hypothetical protein BCR39DRAFT_561900 [Naematelia encephala]